MVKQKWMGATQITVTNLSTGTLNKSGKVCLFQLFFIPGDNGWLDCPRPHYYNGSRHPADIAYKFWQKFLFFAYERSSKSLPSGTEVLRGTSKTIRGARQSYVSSKNQAGLSEDRPELFSFYLRANKALIIGTSTPGAGRFESRWDSNHGRRSLEEDNVKWINYSFDKYNPSVVIILAHTIEDAPGAANREVYLALEELAQDFPYVPFLVLTDEHCFIDIHENRRASNLFMLKLDDTSTPTEIDVDLRRSRHNDMSNVFTYDRGCYCHTDHKPTRKICWDPSKVSNYCVQKCKSLEQVCGNKYVGPFYDSVGSDAVCGCPEGAECCSYGENKCGRYNRCSF